MLLKIIIQAKTIEEVNAISSKLEELNKAIKKYKEPRRCSRKRIKIKPFEEELITSWFKKGHTYISIAKELNRPLSQIMYFVNQMQKKGLLPRRSHKAINKK